MIVPAITLALALAVVLAIVRAELRDRRKHRRWMTVQEAANERIGEDIAWSAYRLDALRAAMVITCRAYSARLDTLTADRFVRDADRAHNMLESALAGATVDG